MSSVGDTLRTVTLGCRLHNDIRVRTMPVDNIWWWPVRWEAINGTITSSMDVMIPAQTVYGFAAMQSFNFTIWATDPSPSGAQGFGAWSGISSYTKNGVPNNVGQGQLGGIVPGIFDDDVDSITFAWGAGAQQLETGDGNTCNADFTFQIFGWG
jgi:hypothetical protein